MGYCTVQNVKDILQIKNSKFLIGTATDDHMTPDQCEIFINIASTKIDGRLREHLPTGSLPITAPVPDDIVYATSFLSSQLISGSNFYTQFNIRDEGGIDDFFEGQYKEFLEKFIHNYKQGVYEATWSGLTSAPRLSTPNLTDFTSTPKYPTNFVNQDVF